MIVEDLEALEQKLLGGKDGAALRALADSDEARRLGQKLNAVQAEKALRSGDGAQLRALLGSLLATGEGRALAEKLKALGEGK